MVSSLPRRTSHSLSSSGDGHGNKVWDCRAAALLALQLANILVASKAEHFVRTHCLDVSKSSESGGGTIALEKWSPETGFGTGELVGATWPPWWSLSLIGRTISRGSFEQMGNMLTKLEQGHPVTILAWGTSITADRGGAYHDSIEQLRAAMRHVPNNYARGEFGRNPDGWLSHFMHELNSTYPHRHHLLVNAGVPGADVNFFANSECFEAYLPHTLDLVIFESLDMFQSTLTNIERLLLRLEHHYKARPAIVVLNTVRVLDLGPGVTLPGQNGYGMELKNEYDCIKDGGLFSGSTHGKNLCRTLCSSKFQQHVVPGSFQGTKAQSEANFDVASQYYGFASLSLRAFLKGAFATRAQQGHSACEVLSSLLTDVVHPGLNGQLLMSHMLTNYMAEAVRHLRRSGWMQSSDNHQAPVMGEGRTLPSLQDNVIGAGQHLAMRCYGDLNAEQDLEQGIAEALQGSWSIMSNTGWDYVVYQVHGEQKKYKPGWVATRPGSHISVKVDTYFPGAPSNATAKVQVAYLASYEHMGKVQIACESGCVCQNSIVDAHDANYKQSVRQSKELAVTMSTECVICVLVLEETSSGEHKFKLEHMTTSAEITAEQSQNG